ncbi:hypothetical protein CesoFtcFv8_012772 [Champsocephalus esox]|uniref:Uncharacterized protein n=1 Tax=Champsocephalus esox TaxID=159716 RepID=A0AAN8GVU7_9TELE|nr:hypothetical protein CesoFtcFv8_012772 [Champsocephalus esox]
MRRSGAPSQLSGNAVKKPRFVSPGASPSFLTAEFKPLSPTLGLGNALEKVQRSLTAPTLGKTEFDAQPKAAHPAPTLSRALARVLSVAESKENEAKHSTTVSEEYSEDNGPEGKTQRLVAGILRATVVMCRLCNTSTLEQVLSLLLLL